MSLALQSPIKQFSNVRVITGDGSFEETPPDAGHWSLLAAVEASHNERTLSSSEPEHEKIDHKSPGYVLEKLLGARSEIDAVIDMISMIEQQQFLAAEHISAPLLSASSAADEAFLRLASRCAQLKSVHFKLKTLSQAMVQQTLVNDRFLSQVKELSKTWKITREGEKGELHIDLTLPLQQSLIQQQEAQLPIVPDGTGDACLVLSKDAVYRGIAAINSALVKLQDWHLWKCIQVILKNQLFTVGTASAAVEQLCTKIQLLTATAVRNRMVDGVQVTDVESGVVEDPIQTVFEAKATQLLVGIMKEPWSLETLEKPNLIKPLIEFIKSSGQTS